MAVPWLSYVPVPGLQVIAVWAAPDDPLTRFHAWQGGLLVAATYLSMVLLGLLAKVSDAPTYLAALGLVSGLVLLGALVGLAVGAVGAARRRYARVRPAWDVLAALGK